MASIIKSVSVTKQEDEFLDEYDLSPTQLLKEKIWELKGMIKSVAQRKIEKQAAALTHINNELSKVTYKYEKLLKENNKNVIQEETEGDDGGEER